MTESRWANWSTGTLRQGRSLSTFTEAVAQSSAAEEAAQKGLTHAGYGYYKDRTGQVVAQSRNGVLVMIAQDERSPATVDMGNPTSAESGMTPADKARSMGFISDGNGSYKDTAGNTVARTVNNELVFYDSRGGGGAVSDGSGGALITQSSPSWVDPETGLIVVPPAQPESPEEVNAVPDPTPATAPAGYDAFVNRRKREIYKDNYQQREIESEIAQQEAQLAELYGQNRETAIFYEKMKEALAAAEQSGDEQKIANASYASKILERDAEQIIDDFNSVGEDKQADVAKMIKARTIVQAKIDQATDNPDPESPYEVIRLKDKQRKIDGEIGSLIDENLGAKKLPKPKALPRSFKRSKGENGEKTFTYSGNDIDYKLTEMEYEGTGGMRELYLDSLKTLRDGRYTDRLDYDVIKDGKVYEVEWDLEEGGMDPDRNKGKYNPDERKRKALDALKTWRKEVLPNLSPGMILQTTPYKDDATDTKRERIYKLAGFGANDPNRGGQVAVVVRDSEGNNRLVPIRPDEGQNLRRMNEEYLRLLDLDLNIMEQNQVARALLI